MTEAVLAIDQGTTATTVVLFDPRNWKVIAKASETFPQIYPQSGWVEHKPEAIWTSVLQALEKVLKTKPEKTVVSCIGITNQRETVVCFNRKTGEAYGNAIVWQDRRTAQRCQRLRQNDSSHETLRRKTGLVADPYFSATKMEWMMQNWEHVGQAVQREEAVFGTIDTYLLARLSSQKSIATEASNACRTLLFSLDALDFDADLLEEFGIPRHALPELLPSRGTFGTTSGVPGIADGTPILAMLGDQQAALYGQGAHGAGEAKVTFGTGAFLLMNTGERRVEASANSGLLSSVAVGQGKETTYCLEGACFIAGAAVQFVRDELGFFADAAESEACALSEPQDPNILFVPSLAGLAAPHWNPHAKGVLFGLSRGSSRAQITRAVLESIALQNVPFVKAMQQESGLELAWLGVDGGAAANNYLVQFQADVLQCELLRPEQLEATSLGVAQAAWHEHTLMSSPRASSLPDKTDSPKEIFRPKTTTQEARECFHRWQRAADAVNAFYGS